MSSIRYTFNDDYSQNNSKTASDNQGNTSFSDPAINRVFADPNGYFYAFDSNRVYILVNQEFTDALKWAETGISVDFSDKASDVNLQGGNRGDILRSGIGNDTLNGGGGNDVLEGGAGGDALNGGAGSDTVSYEHSTSGVEVRLDLDKGFSNDSSGDNYDSIESIRGSNATVPLFDGRWVDALYGNTSRNVIEGGGGADFILGGGGGDVASYVHSSQGVTINLLKNSNTGGDAEGDSLNDMRDVLGSAHADSLTGDGQNNTLDGGAGADTLSGGGGNDTYVVDDKGDVVVETDGFGTDTVLSNTSYTLAAGVSVETLRLLSSTGNANLNLTGNEFGQRLLGNGGDNVLKGLGGNDTLLAYAGNDTLDGGTGADVMTGGIGNDTYYVDDAKDRVVESFKGGDDTVITSISYTLSNGSQVETLKAADGDADINLTGNGLNNTLIGNDGDNRLNGGAGVDTLQGNKGNDTYTTNGDDTIVETTDASGGIDAVISTAASFRLGEGVGIEKLQIAGSVEAKGPSELIGNEQDQRLTGNAKANLLDGAGGNDALQGLGGNDTFQFSTALDSESISHVRDFKVGEDMIQLAFKESYSLPIDDSGQLAASAFADVTNGNDGVTQDTRILYNAKTGALSYDADGSGSGEAIHFATLDNHAAIGASDIGLLLVA